MSDPSLSLQAAMVAAFRARSALTALVGTAIYDQPPSNAPIPATRVIVGDDIVLDDATDCVDGYEVYSEVRAWTEGVGYPLLKTIAAEIRAAVVVDGLTLTGFDLIESNWERTAYTRDGDGIMRRADIRFRFFVNSRA